jgi:hypothetical protein
LTGIVDIRKCLRRLCEPSNFETPAFICVSILKDLLNKIDVHKNRCIF